MLIIHGDNTPASRQHFLALKQQAAAGNFHVVDLPGQTLTLPELASCVSAVSLFGSANSVFVEDFFSRRPSAEKDKIRDYLSVNTPAGIVVWEAKDVSSQLKTYPVASVRKFELPKYVFQFLDSFSLPALRSALRTTAPELVFSLLSGHLHKLIMVKDGIGSFPSWQQSKLRSLASRFTLGRLLKMNEELLTIDLKQKTSSAPYSLSAALELFTVKINN